MSRFSSLPVGESWIAAPPLTCGFPQLFSPQTLAAHLRRCRRQWLVQACVWGALVKAFSRGNLRIGTFCFGFIPLKLYLHLIIAKVIFKNVILFIEAVLSFLRQLHVFLLFFKLTALNTCWFYWVCVTENEGWRMAGVITKMLLWGQVFAPFAPCFEGLWPCLPVWVHQHFWWFWKDLGCCWGRVWLIEDFI